MRSVGPNPPGNPFGQGNGTQDARPFTYSQRNAKEWATTLRWWPAPCALDPMPSHVWSHEMSRVPTRDPPRVTSVGYCTETTAATVPMQS